MPDTQTVMNELVEQLSGKALNEFTGSVMARQEIRKWLKSQLAEVEK